MMSTTKLHSGSSFVSFAGAAVLAFGLLGMIGHLLYRNHYSVELNAIYYAGDQAFTALGVVTVSLGRAFRKIEELIDGAKTNRR